MERWITKVLANESVKGWARQLGKPKANSEVVGAIEGDSVGDPVRMVIGCDIGLDEGIHIGLAEGLAEGLAKDSLKDWPKVALWLGWAKTQTQDNRKISMIFPLVSCCSCVNKPSSS